VIGHEGVETFDLRSTPTRPTAAGWWPIWLREVEAHTVVDDHLLLVGDAAHHLWSLDLSDPSRPTTAAMVPLTDHPEATIESARMVRIGDTVAVSRYSSWADRYEVLILDVADPASPELLSIVPDVLDRPQLTAVGSTIFATGDNASGEAQAVLIDITDPSEPAVVARHDLVGGFGDGALNRRAVSMLTNNHLATVHLECRPPAAEIGVATAGRLARLSDASWYGPDESYWDLGDGTLATGSTVLHTFPEPGWYDIALESFNDHGGDRTTIRLPVGCDLDHDRAVTGDDVAHLVAELFDGDGTSASHAWAGSHRGAIDYDIDETGEIALEDLMRLLPLVTD
jgi:hypothetical protein